MCLSAPHYVATDIGAASANTSGQRLIALGISDAGLAAVSEQSSHELYFYSSRRHRLYAGPMKTSSRARSFGTGGELLVALPTATVNGGTTVYYDLNTATGASHELTFHLPDQSGGNAAVTVPEAVNAAGVSVGEYLLTGAPTGGPVVGREPAFYDPATDQSSLLNIPSGFSNDPFINPAPLLNERANIAFGNAIYSSPTAVPTKLPRGDQSVTALSNTFAAGQASNGIYLYNLTTGTQVTAPLPFGAVSFAPAAVNDDGIVVGQMLIYQRVRGRGSAQAFTVAAAFEHGKFFNLNALAKLPAGVKLTNATAINRSGQILAVDDAANYGGHVVLLDPVLV